MSEGAPSRARRDEDDAEEIAAEEQALSADSASPEEGSARADRLRIAASPDPGRAPSPAIAPPRPEPSLELRSKRPSLPVLPALGLLAMASFAYLAVTATSVFSLFFLGFSMIGTAVLWALTFGGEEIHTIDLAKDGVVLHSVDGSSVKIPRRALSHASVELVVTATGKGQKTIANHHVHLHKRDGGVIDLGLREDERSASALATAMNGDLARGDRLGPGAMVPVGATAHLEGARSVTFRRDEGTARTDYRTAPGDPTLALEWSLRPQHRVVVPGLLAPLGFACASLGMWLEKGLWMAGVMGVIALLIEAGLVFGFVRRLGRSQVLRVGARELSIEEHQGGNCVVRKAIPLEDIHAVDFSVEANRLGGDLHVRTADAERPPRVEDSDSPEEAVQRIRDAVKFHRAGQRIDLGRLSFGDKVRVDLAVSAEIAQRTGRNEAEL